MTGTIEVSDRNEAQSKISADTPWHEVTVQGETPLARFAHTLTRISSSQCLVFGGVSPGQDCDDIYLLTQDSARKWAKDRWVWIGGVADFVIRLQFGKSIRFRICWHSVCSVALHTAKIFMHCNGCRWVVMVLVLRPHIHFRETWPPPRSKTMNLATEGGCDGITSEHFLWETTFIEDNILETHTFVYSLMGFLEWIILNILRMV